jgi:GMP synthase-like glutamine amidotransferase
MKIKILIINNSTVPQKNLENFLSNYGEVSAVHFRSLKDAYNTVKDAELVVLSGSSDVPLGSEKEMYKDEIEFIQTSHCPIIGICFGFEAIAISQGEDLVKSKEKIYGLKEIILDKNFFKLEKALVWQNHSWCLMAAKALNVLSESVNGHEIIKIPGKQIYGIQFHPEHIDPKNDGKEVFNEILEEIFEVNKI